MKYILSGLSFVLALSISIAQWTSVLKRNK